MAHRGVPLVERGNRPLRVAVSAVVMRDIKARLEVIETVQQRRADSNLSDEEANLYQSLEVLAAKVSIYKAEFEKSLRIATT
ncbi:hypothetical protein KI387_028046, partial [Taxus chinensis]